MNKLVAFSLFAAAAAFTVAPQTVRADDDEAVAAIGGFIGGLIVGSALDNDRDHHGSYHESGVQVSTRVVIGGHGHRHGRYERHRHHDHGYWDVQRVRVWVPGRWVVHVDDCGRRHRHFERGHYEYRRDRVWVRSGRGRCVVCR